MREKTLSDFLYGGLAYKYENGLLKPPTPTPFTVDTIEGVHIVQDEKQRDVGAWRESLVNKTGGIKVVTSDPDDTKARTYYATVMLPIAVECGFRPIYIPTGNGMGAYLRYKHTESGTSPYRRNTLIVLYGFFHEDVDCCKAAYDVCLDFSGYSIVIVAGGTNPYRLMRERLRMDYQYAAFLRDRNANTKTAVLR